MDTREVGKYQAGRGTRLTQGQKEVFQLWKENGMALEGLKASYTGTETASDKDTP